MKNGKPIIYWDTCVFIAWLKDERNVWGSDVMCGIDDVFQMVGRNDAYLVTSAITRSEIFLATLTLEEKQKFADILRRKNVDERAADFKITDRASELRFGFSIKTPDAIHLATATIARADELQTMDGLEPQTRKCNSGMLKLNGKLKYKLLIIPPYKRLPNMTAATSKEEPGAEINGAGQIRLGLKPGENNEQPQSTAETNNELQTNTAHTASLQGGDVGRAQGEPAGQANEGQPEKPKPAEEGGLGESGH